MTAPALDLFLVSAPGLDAALADEALAAGFADARDVPGGVTLSGDWESVWRANLMLRGAVRVLVRVDSFRAMHLAQLDKRARRVDWAQLLRSDAPFKVEASCKRSRIYHDKAAAQRVALAITDAIGAPLADDAPVRVMVRIEDDLATLSIDTSGEPLHRRGHKLAVNAAPMRETTAALLLRQAGYTGAGPVLDPMCGSGTFVIESAEMALGLAPGRARSFAFEHLATFDDRQWTTMKRRLSGPTRSADPLFFGSDRDAGAIRMSIENAERAGVLAVTGFAHLPVSELARPQTAPGLVIVNPPYGLRLGKQKPPTALYAALGRTLRERFAGWQVALVTSDSRLARATGLGFETPFPTVDNNGVRITLHVAALPG